MEWSKLLKKSSNASLRLSRILTIWFLNFTLCWLKLSLISFLIGISLSLTSLTEFSTSYYIDLWKSILSIEFWGTTGCNKWFEFKQRQQTRSWHFIQNNINDSLWSLHRSISEIDRSYSYWTYDVFRAYDWFWFLCYSITMSKLEVEIMLWLFLKWSFKLTLLSSWLSIGT